ncbi:hypothetical protein [Gordonia sp. SID5947]|uniref:hypothetical protein n=1 Tax=Gordonia sp. SID5947 TaxID=2690315 RepID=UPI001F18B550|nr:hypothetical protein [Gordonia sp. SID5947]
MTPSTSPARSIAILNARRIRTSVIGPSLAAGSKATIVVDAVDENNVPVPEFRSPGALAEEIWKEPSIAPDCNAWVIVFDEVMNWNVIAAACARSSGFQ